VRNANRVFGIKPVPTPQAPLIRKAAISRAGCQPRLKGLERQHDLASIDPAKREILVADRMVKLMAFRSKAMRQLVRASRDMQLISRARHRQEPLVMVSASRRTPKDKLNASCRSAKRRMGADAPHRKKISAREPAERPQELRSSGTAISLPLLRFYWRGTPKYRFPEPFDGG